RAEHVRAPDAALIVHLPPEGRLGELAELGARRAHELVHLDVALLGAEEEARRGARARIERGELLAERRHVAPARRVGVLRRELPQDLERLVELALLGRALGARDRLVRIARREGVAPADRLLELGVHLVVVRLVGELLDLRDDRLRLREGVRRAARELLGLRARGERDRLVV